MERGERGGEGREGWRGERGERGKMGVKGKDRGERGQCHVLSHRRCGCCLRRGDALDLIGRLGDVEGAVVLEFLPPVGSRELGLTLAVVCGEGAHAHARVEWRALEVGGDHDHGVAAVHEGVGADCVLSPEVGNDHGRGGVVSHVKLKAWVRGLHDGVGVDVDSGGDDAFPFGCLDGRVGDREHLTGAGAVAVVRPEYGPCFLHGAVGAHHVAIARLEPDCAVLGDLVLEVVGDLDDEGLELPDHVGLGGPVGEDVMDGVRVMRRWLVPCLKRIGVGGGRERGVSVRES